MDKSNGSGIPIKCQRKKRLKADDSFPQQVGRAWTNQNGTGFTLKFYDHPKQVDPKNFQVEYSDIQVYMDAIVADENMYNMIISHLKQLQKFQLEWAPVVPQTELFSEGELS